MLLASLLWCLFPREKRDENKCITAVISTLWTSCFLPHKKRHEDKGDCKKRSIAIWQVDFIALSWFEIRLANWPKFWVRRAKIYHFHVSPWSSFSVSKCFQTWEYISPCMWACKLCQVFVFKTILQEEVSFPSSLKFFLQPKVKSISIVLDDIPCTEKFVAL